MTKPMPEKWLARPDAARVDRARTTLADGVGSRRRTRRARRHLWQLGDESDRPLVLSVARTHPEPRVRSSVLFVLRAIGTGGLEGELAVIVREDDWRVGEEALLLLVKAQGPLAVEALCSCAEHEDPHVRFVVSNMVRRAEPGLALPVCLHILRTETQDEDVWISAVLGYEDHAQASDAAVLRQPAVHRNAEARRRIAFQVARRLDGRDA